jgi:hypothetical protein
MHDPRLNLSHVYFFRLFVDGTERNQALGLAFSSREDAWHEAAAATAKIIAGKDVVLTPGLDWRMDVTDAAGGLVYRFAFKAEQHTATA